MILYGIVLLIGFAAGILVSRSSFGDYLVSRLSLKSGEPFDLSHLILNVPSRPSTAWGNLGYWEDTDDFIIANRRLAQVLGDKAQLSTEDSILDLGFGMGEQIKFWKDHYDIASYQGLNPSRSQYSFARSHILPGLPHSFHIYCEDSSYIPKINTKFSKILALDCAYHFRTRKIFFKDAFQALMPKGELVLTDMIPSKTQGLSFFFQKIIFPLGGVSRKNLVDIDSYRKQMTEAGFQSIEISDISTHVFSGMHHFLNSFIETKRDQLKPRTLAPFKITKTLLENWGLQGKIQYILVKAQKPSL